jgi:hypothetical protein
VFSELTEAGDDIGLAVYWSVPGVKEIADYVWDTSLPELDAPWPHHVPENLDLRSMVSWLSGRPDVTTYLYELAELEEYERTGIVPWADDVTALMEAVK